MPPLSILKNCDFELKIECGRRFIAGASYGGLEMKTALMNVEVVVLQGVRILVSLYEIKTYLLSGVSTPTRPLLPAFLKPHTLTPEVQLCLYGLGASPFCPDKGAPKTHI